MSPKIAIIFGTRPEVIKTAPVIYKLKQYPHKFNLITIVSGQHDDLLTQALKAMSISPDYNFKIMVANQTLFHIQLTLLSRLKTLLAHLKPNLVLVQGDTTTAYVGALAAFYLSIPVGHIEAGLRTYNIYEPYPEEFNRHSIDTIATLLFAPSVVAKINLLKEGKQKNCIFVTGNTSIDALKYMMAKLHKFTEPQLTQINFSKKIILMTLHRRELTLKNIFSIFKAIEKVISEYPHIEVLYPVHPSNRIKLLAMKYFHKKRNIHITSPLDFKDMVAVLKKCYCVVTDSGGLQEEAPFFHKPVVVLRERTERSEGVTAGTLLLAGVNEEYIFKILKKVITDQSFYTKIARAKNPYGDGTASTKIYYALNSYFYR